MAIEQLILLVTAIFLYFISYRCYVSENYKFSLTFIILGGLVLRLMTIHDPYIHEWDERYHFLVAKNLSDNFFVPRLYPKDLLAYNYKDWTSNYIWLHKPPFSLWCIALSFKIFGVSELTGRLPSLLFSLTCVYLTYLIAVKLSGNAKIGLIAAFLHSINGMIIEMSAGRAATDHVDTVFFFLIELIIYISLLYKDKNRVLFSLLLGVLVGVAILTKWFVALFAIGMFVIINISKENKWTIAFSAFVITAIAFFMYHCWNDYIMSMFPNEAQWEKSYNSKHLTEAIEGHGHPWYYHIDKARMIWNESIYVVFLWFIYLWYKKFWTRFYFILGFWTIIPYTIFSIAATKMQGYLLFTAPAFFILMAMFMEDNRQFFQQKFYLKYIPLLILLLSIRFCIERVKPFKNLAELAQKKEHILNYSKQLEDKTVIFNAKNYVEIMFYTQLMAYDRIPTASEIEEIKQKGYHIAIINTAKIPNYIQSDQSLQLIDP
jgi:4-amino-4-deoxy-L-arabinose transferase-like glycosyltransferase